MSDEEALSEYIDGRMTREARHAFEARLKAEPALARRARLLRAMKSALAASAPPMPADLKAALKCEARARACAPSWSVRLRGALAGGGSWTYGVGAAAFAAAALALALWRSLPPRRAGAVPGEGVRSAAGWSDPVLARGLEGMWSDDAGGDEDEG